MRIAIDHTSEVGVRAGRILLGERTLDVLGVVGDSPGSSDDRLVTVDDLADFDVVVTDDANDPTDLIEEALDARISCVLWGDGEREAEIYGDRFVATLQTLLVGANLASGITPALAGHERARTDEVLDVTLAWTEPGRPLRRGHAISFPDPVGPRWAAERSRRGKERVYVAPVDDEWAGAMARVTGSTGDGVVTRVVGVSDLAVHLEALALAAGAMAVAAGTYSPGVHRPADGSDDYLARVLGAGLEVASHVLD